MNNTAQTAHYEESINLLCEKAKAVCSGYREGYRDETGHPYGVSPYALVAKLLCKFDEDGINPVSPLENLDDFSSYYDKVFHAFSSLYMVKPEIAAVKYGGDFLSDYILRESAT